MVTKCDDAATQLKVINHQPKNEHQITMQISLYGAATQKVYTKKPKKSAQVFYWKIKILYLPTPSFWSKRVKL